MIHRQFVGLLALAFGLSVIGHWVGLGQPSGGTNLLFSFVTNQTGFDTGIAITNESLTPASAGVPGSCALNYYGSIIGGGTFLRQSGYRWRRGVKLFLPFREVATVYRRFQDFRATS